MSVSVSGSTNVTDVVVEREKVSKAITMNTLDVNEARKRLMDALGDSSKR